MWEHCGMFDQTRPRNSRSLVRVVGRGKSRTALTLDSSGWMPCGVTLWPRNSRVETPKTHLAGFMTMPYCRNRANSCCKCCSCSVALLLVMRMSSVYA